MMSFFYYMGLGVSGDLVLNSHLYDEVLDTIFHVSSSQ